MTRLDMQDKVAVVTGAAGGIGRSLATLLASQGCSVALCDIDSDGLGATRTECEASGVQAVSATLDVARREAVFSWAGEVLSSLGAVHFVFNNAGTTLVSRVRNLSTEELADVDQASVDALAFSFLIPEAPRTGGKGG